MAEWRQDVHGEQYYGRYSTPRQETMVARHAMPNDGRPRGMFDRPDAHPRNWLLLLPIVLPLAPMLYNRIDPAFLGIPFFYWCQLGFAFLASGIITYLHLRSR